MPSKKKNHAQPRVWLIGRASSLTNSSKVYIDVDQQDWVVGLESRDTTNGLCLTIRAILAT